MILVERWSQKGLFITNYRISAKRITFQKKQPAYWLKKYMGIGPSAQL
jgi:hypothetical protein